MRQLREFTDAVNEMENHGITHQTLRNKYHMTEWGARKFADIVSTGYKEIDGRGKKKYQRSESAPELDHETRHESIPVTNNYSQEVRESQHSKAQNTQEARDFIERVERKVKTVEAPTVEWDDYETEYGNIDVVWHETDTHIGALVENDHGEVVFDTEYAEQLVYQKLNDFELYLDKKAERNDIDTIHWLLGGDLVEGTGIYQGQAHEIDMYINEQLEKASEVMIACVKRLAELAEGYNAKLQIVTVPGNHGDLRVKGSSNQASFDDVVYHTLALALDTYLEGKTMQSEVRLKRSDNVVGMTFPLRNHTGYLTHGQNMKEHVGTSSGKKDALSIQNQYGCDVIFRGHYHMPKLEDVNGMPVVMTPSIKPGGQYEDSMQAYSNPGYAFYAADDRNPIKDAQYYRTDFQRAKPSEVLL